MAARPLLRRIVALCVVATLAAVAPSVVGEAPRVGATEPEQEEINRLKRERDALQDQLREAAAGVDAATAEALDLTQALADLEVVVDQQRADLTDAERAVAAAEAARGAAERRAGELANERDEVRTQAVDLAVNTYVGRNSAEEGAFGLARTGNIADANRIQTLVGAALGNITDTGDTLRALQLDTEAAADRLDELAAAEEVTRQAQEVQLGRLLDTVEIQEALVAEAELRLDARLAEAEAVQSIDAELADQIRQQEQALAARLEAERRAREEAARRAREEEARRREAARRAAGGQQPSGGGGVNPSEIVTVNGIRVHVSIADQLENLLAAARADGISLTGGGYRTNSSQIALRRAHCGTSDYDIYQKPASQCRPPTARPGNSMHEVGLAIDFAQNGRALNRSSSGYAWLRANAASYGLKNLPSEPWHWSTNGR